MIRVMGDSTVVARIPQRWNGRPLDIAAVYGTGLYTARAADVAARFPAAHYVTVWIDAIGTAPQACQVLDVERYDATPQHAPGWIRKRASLVHTSLPTVYCNRSTLPDVEASCSAAGLHPGKHYQLWISTLDGTETYQGRHLSAVPGVVACQLEGGPGATWDRSVVYDDRWHPLA
jgi:hypothetical protein